MEDIAAFAPFVIIIGVFYLFAILPQQRRNRAQQELLASLEEGDEVMTAGGFYGFVAAMDGDVIWLEVAPDVELKFQKSMVTSKVDSDIDSSHSET